jgi:hypothetical protein
LGGDRPDILIIQKTLTSREGPFSWQGKYVERSGFLDHKEAENGIRLIAKDASVCQTSTVLTILLTPQRNRSTRGHG